MFLLYNLIRFENIGPQKLCNVSTEVMRYFRRPRYSKMDRIIQKVEKCSSSTKM